MKNYKNGDRYESFAELAESLGLKPVRRVTKDANKLKDQKKRFSNKHICPVCKQPMVLIPDTNIMTCTNEECKGRKVKTSDGSAKYDVVFDELDEHGAIVANVIFSDKGR